LLHSFHVDNYQKPKKEKETKRKFKSTLYVVSNHPLIYRHTEIHIYKNTVVGVRLLMKRRNKKRRKKEKEKREKRKERKRR